MRTAVRIAMLLFGLSPEAGAKTSIYLASAPEVADTSGQYFVKAAPAPVSAAGQDEAAAERLWRLSESLTGLDAQAPPEGQQAQGQTNAGGEADPVDPEPSLGHGEEQDAGGDYGSQQPAPGIAP